MTVELYCSAVNMCQQGVEDMVMSKLVCIHIERGYRSIGSLTIAVNPHLTVFEWIINSWMGWTVNWDSMPLRGEANNIWDSVEFRLAITVVFPVVWFNIVNRWEPVQVDRHSVIKHIPLPLRVSHNQITYVQPILSSLNKSQPLINKQTCHSLPSPNTHARQQDLLLLPPALTQTRADLPGACSTKRVT